MPKLTLWGTIVGNALRFEAFNRARLADWGKERQGKDIRVEFSDKSTPKSEEQLGYYWGAVLPSIIAHDKNLPFHPANLKDLIKQKKITRDEIEAMHWTLMTEFRPMMVFDLRTGKPSKQRGEMKQMNNSQLAEFVNEVTEWMASNGYKVPDSDEYKRYRDGMLEYSHDPSPLKDTKF